MAAQTHQLQHVWVLWEHKTVNKQEEWANSMREVCEFSTVEEFWKYWSFVPRPSEVLFDGHSRKGEKRLLKDFFVI
jgi:hypothetical protein